MVTYPYAYMTYIVSLLAGLGGAYRSGRPPTACSEQSTKEDALRYAVQVCQEFAAPMNKSMAESRLLRSTFIGRYEPSMASTDVLKRRVKGCQQ